MRKLFIVAALAAVFPATLAGAATDAGTPAWNYQAYKTAVEASGRTHNISEKTFKQLQENRLKALVIIEKYLTQRFGKADPLVMKAFSELPREYYHHNYESKKSFAAAAYELENVKPWAIGYGSALSDYLGQAYMTQIAKPRPTDVVLEIGTGSGYQVSILSRIVKQAYSIEIIKPLGEGVAPIFKPLGYNNIQTRVGDGFYGWPEVKGGFDIIIVTCVAQYVPPALLEQLKPGGRLVIPIGQPFKKGGQFLYVYTKDAQGKVHSRKYTSVYFIPMTGAMEKQKPAAAP
jgi:protein-L-isoaspartate(D-aspartate) O-methyltransferase